MDHRSQSGDTTNGAPRADRPASRRGGLGRGLGALIPSSPHRESDGTGGAGTTADVPIDAIEPNPFQPRAAIDPSKLQALAESIRLHGVIQPLVVKHGQDAGQYTLIAGERRWRAARAAGLSAVPVVIMDAAPQAMLELALVENVVRADLSPLEEAHAYRQLIDEFGMTQAVVAERVGRSRVSVTNTLRLLTAPDAVQLAISTGHITEGHARALLGLPTGADQIAMLDVVIARGFTVRQTEDAVRKWLAGAGSRSESTTRDPESARLEDRFRSALGTKVLFRRNASGPGGSLTIQYYSDEELDALYRRLLGEDIW